MPVADLSGQKFGRLTVLEFLGNRKWLCVCICGNQRKVFTSNLTRGHTKSCGCIMLETAKSRKKRLGQHNLSHTLEHHSWAAMIRRCTSEKHDKWKYYGGRGIGVCDRWRLGQDGQTAFECFLADMGEKPTPKHTLDRTDNNADYSPENCKWVTFKENCRNKRSNVRVRFNGKEMILNDAFDAAHGSSRGFSSLHGNYFRRLQNGMTHQDAFDGAVAKREKLRRNRERRRHLSGSAST